MLAKKVQNNAGIQAPRVIVYVHREPSRSYRNDGY